MKPSKEEKLRTRYENYKKATFEEFMDYQAENELAIREEFAKKLEQLKKEFNNKVMELDKCLILSSHGDYFPLQRRTWELFKCNLFEVLNKKKINEMKTKW